jgi:hypothetical protein
MRRLVTALASLAVVFLLIPSIGLAIDPPAANGVGVMCIFTSDDIAAANNVIEVATPFVQHRLYFVLYHPQIASSTLGAATFSWRLDPVPAVAPILTLTLPPSTLNIGTNYNVIMGFGAGVPVVDNHAVVLTVDALFLANPGPTVIYFGPPDPTSIPGHMEYNDFFDPGNRQGSVPNSVDGLYENPVFGLDMVVATEPTTWSGVKALFR